MPPQKELSREEQQQEKSEKRTKESTQTGAAEEPKMDPGDTGTGPACAQDVAAYCQKDANVVALLREAPDVVEPRKIVEALRKVRLCMISHADVLSVDCVDTLSANAMATAPTTVPVKKVPAELDNDGVDDDSSMEINIYYSRHHNGAGHALRSGGALAANHVQTGAPASIFTEVLAHPVTWMFVLPFFAIGMYVSLTRMATFVRRRREERRIVGKQYMPVN